MIQIVKELVSCQIQDSAYTKVSWNLYKNNLAFLLVNVFDSDSSKIDYILRIKFDDVIVQRRIIVKILFKILFC